MDWDNYVKVFKISIDDIEVKKEVSKADVIMSLMSDGDVAYKFKGNQMIMKIDKVTDIELLKQIIWNPIEDYIKQLQELKSQETKSRVLTNGNTNDSSPDIKLKKENK